MRISKLGFIITVLLLTILQQVINQNTTLYLDIVGVVAISVLLNIEYTLTTLAIVSIFADLVGHWYLGTHLFASIITSLLTQSVINFYRMCNPLQKAFFASVFYLILLLLVALIGYITHNIVVSITNFILNIIIVCPITMYILNRYAYKISPDIIRYN